MCMLCRMFDESPVETVVLSQYYVTFRGPFMIVIGVHYLLGIAGDWEIVLDEHETVDIIPMF